MESRLDKNDLKILNLLQKDARMSVAEIGRQIHLSQPSIAERIRRMESAGIIQGYHAIVNQDVFGYQIVALVRVVTKQGARYEEFARLQPEVIDCYTVTGEDGAIFKVVATDVHHLRRIVDKISKFGTTCTAIVLCIHVLNKALSPPTA